MTSRSSLRDFINKMSPGPAAYTPAYSQIFEKAPDSNLKGGSKYDFKLDDVPGPGFYDVRKGFKGPKWG